MKHGGIMKQIFYLILVCFISSMLCSCINREILIYNNESLTNMKKKASDNQFVFCIVLIDSGSYAADMYIDKLNSEVELTKNVLFDFVDIARPENVWFEQWIFPQSLPLTCLFSSDGELLDIIKGISYESFEYLKLSVKKKEFVKDDNNSFGITKNKLLCGLNQILKCKEKMESGNDARIDLLHSLEIIEYPFNLGMLLKNERKLRRQQSCFETAGNLLKCKNESTVLLYAEQFYDAETVLDPKYNKSTAPYLLVSSDTIDLKECRLNETKNVKFELQNKGDFPLCIFNVLTSCSCLKYVGDKNLIILGNESSCLRFEFTPDVGGDIVRNAFIISDAVNLSLCELTVTANVK